MKKLLSIFLFLVSFAAIGQSGSQAVSGIKYRVNDSTSYLSAVAGAHTQGYADIFWNNQATTPHWDIWNGSSYDHVFDFNAGGGGGSSEFEYDVQVISGTTHTINAAAIGALNKYYIYTNASGCTVTMSNDVPANRSITARSGPSAGTITFVDNGTSVLTTSSGDFDLQGVNRIASWVKETSTAWYGTGELGAGGGGGGGTWGTITGTLSDQTDLQTALDGKVNDTGNETIAGIKTFSSTIVGSVNGNAATVTTNANLTGDVTSTGNATTIASGVIVDADVNASAAIAGTKIANTPAGNIAATTSQAAINELDTEKQPLDSDLTSWAGVTRASGFDTWATTPTSANLAATITDEIGAGPLAFSEISVNTQTGTTYTLLASDVAKVIRFTNAGSIVLTIPTNGTAAIPVNSRIEIGRFGGGIITVTPSGGVTLTNTAGNNLSPGGTTQLYSSMILTKIATDTWHLMNGSNGYENGSGTTANGNKIDLGGTLTGSTNIAGGLVGFSITPTSTVHSGGSFAANITTTAVDLTLSESHYVVIVNTTSATRTITLPAASTCTGRVYIIKKSVAANTMNIDPNGTETIDGSSTTVAITTQWQKLGIISDGTNWLTIID